MFQHTWCAWPIGYALLSPDTKLRWIQMSGQKCDQDETAVIKTTDSQLRFPDGASPSSTGYVQINSRAASTLDSFSIFRKWRGKCAHKEGRLRDDSCISPVKKCRWACRSERKHNELTASISPFYLITHTDSTSSYSTPLEKKKKLQCHLVGTWHIQ